MKTPTDLRREADALGSPALPDTEYATAHGIWGDEYRDYDRRSALLAAEFPHEFDLRYGPDPRQIVDVWLPAEPVTDAPVLVFFHGGSLEDGHPRQYGFLARPYLEAGAVVVLPSYRLLDPALAAERRRQEREADVFVHQLSAAAGARYERTRRAGAEAAVTAAQDAREAVAWVHRNIAAYGGRADRLVVSGHSAGALLTVTTGCADDWQAAAGVPEDLVAGIMPISGRYGLHLASAIISHRDIDYPPEDWRIPRAPRAAVVFGELETDGEGKDVPERAVDCARIGRGLVAGLQAAGGDAREVALPPCNHSESVRSLGDPHSPTARAAFELLGVTA